ncbi:uncharacterized protein BCR38DRAFT_519915 [Pseudomassariella vexata]|uniref:Uncharacterized protein n=1 Tax=Pseudomassariella vexata TaxID=1141098 RepID=A0A1Y2EJ31_9PEZI|nr:uncharacterized protein BCR38DRAFT_519915 [Pseudomassariella vexata]ORY71550.1 hypothetical protein BCR38DRAFT_519915 [Pseudomassariella vexata]
MGGDFGDDVSALVSMYSRCLTLLKAFKGGQARTGSGDGHGNGKGDPDLSKDYSRLRRSVRSDRDQVRRAYSSRLYKNGSRLEKGDSRSRSAIRRILDRLKVAILKLLNMAKTQQRPVMDYQSLLSLSTSSRVHAIKTMDQLSRRLSSSSSLLRENRRPISSKSSKSSNKSTRRHSSHHHSPPRAPKTTRESKQSPLASTVEAYPEAARHAASPSTNTRRKTARSKMRREEAKTTAKTRKAEGPTHSHSENSPATASPAMPMDDPNRISFVSISSDSTKLGEIPYQRSRLMRLPDTVSDEYDVQPIYPLRPYRTPPKERSFLRRLFGNREKD